MECGLRKMLVEQGFIPLRFEEIKPGMKICKDTEKAYCMEVIEVKDKITVKTEHSTKEIPFQEDLYIYNPL